MDRDASRCAGDAGAGKRRRYGVSARIDPERHERAAKMPGARRVKERDLGVRVALRICHDAGSQRERCAEFHIHDDAVPGGIVEPEDLRDRGVTSTWLRFRRPLNERSGSGDGRQHAGHHVVAAEAG